MHLNTPRGITSYRTFSVSNAPGFRVIFRENRKGGYLSGFKLVGVIAKMGEKPYGNKV